jgi:flagellin
MAAVLGTNMASVWASKNLRSAQSNMASSVERLSSGLAINRAKDDAAGLAIANSLTQQINGANQGIKNINDAISVVQTAEGAINAASEMAQRILTLATQGSNGTASQENRASIQAELKTLLSSISSIATRTKFSGNSLLDTDVAATTEDSGTKFSITLSSATSDSLNLANSAFQDIGATFGFVNAGNATTASTALVLSQALTTWPNVSLTSTSQVYKLSGGVLTTLEVSSASGSTITLDSAATWASTDLIVFERGLLSKDGTTGDTQYSLLESVYHDDLDHASIVTAAPLFAKVQSAASTYIDLLNKQRASLGAIQNQLEFTSSNVTEISANLTSARSRVIDTDYATETASLTKGQILQQAATAMLAQANQMPNVILSLLK